MPCAGMTWPLMRASWDGSKRRSPLPFKTTMTETTLFASFQPCLGTWTGTSGVNPLIGFKSVAIIASSVLPTMVGTAFTFECPVDDNIATGLELRGLTFPATGKILTTCLSTKAVPNNRSLPRCSMMRKPTEVVISPTRTMNGIYPVASSGSLDAEVSGAVLTGAIEASHFFGVNSLAIKLKWAPVSTKQVAGTILATVGPKERLI